MLALVSVSQMRKWKLRRSALESPVYHTRVSKIPGQDSVPHHPSLMYP